MLRKLITAGLALAASLCVAVSPAPAQPSIDPRVVPSSVLKTVNALSDLDASFFAKYSDGEAVFLQEAGREGVWVRRDNWAPQWLADADTANCVVKLDPSDGSAPYTAFFREDWLKGSPLVLNWCGVKTTNTALVNAQNFNKAEDLAGRMAVELIDKKAGVATVPVEIAGGDAAYPLRPGIVINRHGVDLDLGAAVFQAESGVSGALIQNGFEDEPDCNAATSSEFCESNKAIIRNGTLRGDASALFAYDATAGQIGVLLGKCVRGCEVNNVTIEKFDTGIKLAGTFGAVFNNNIISSSGTASPSAETACIYIAGGTATNFNGGRCDYSNGEGVVVVDGGTSGGSTNALNFYGFVIQGGEKRGLYAKEIDNFAYFGGDFENSDNSGGDYPFAEFINTTVKRGAVAFYGTNFIETGADDDSNAPLFKWTNFASFTGEDIFARDQVRADITAIGQAEGTNGTARFSGRIQTNDPASDSLGANAATVMGVIGSGTFERPVEDRMCYQLNGAAYADVVCPLPDLSADTITVDTAIAMNGASLSQPLIDGLKLGVTLTSSNATTACDKSLYAVDASGGNRVVTLEDDCYGASYVIVRNSANAQGVSGAGYLRVKSEVGGAEPLLQWAGFTDTGSAGGVGVQCPEVQCALLIVSGASDSPNKRWIVLPLYGTLTAY